jgi:hypothetical protein
MIRVDVTQPARELAEFVRMGRPGGTGLVLARKA